MNFKIVQFGSDFENVEYAEPLLVLYNPALNTLGITARDWEIVLYDTPIPVYSPTSSPRERLRRRLRRELDTVYHGTFTDMGPDWIIVGEF